MGAKVTIRRAATNGQDVYFEEMYAAANSYQVNNEGDLFLFNEAGSARVAVYSRGFWVSAALID